MHTIRSWCRANAMPVIAVLAAAVSLWCMGDNLWPVVKENGAAWALRAAGLQAATSQEVPQAEASPAPQKEAVKETEDPLSAFEILQKRIGRSA